jgi:hypothetical protein
MIADRPFADPLIATTPAVRPAVRAAVAGPAVAEAAVRAGPASLSP